MSWTETLQSETTATGTSGSEFFSERRLEEKERMSRLLSPGGPPTKTELQDLQLSSGVRTMASIHDSIPELSSSDLGWKESQ